MCVWSHMFFLPLGPINVSEVPQKSMTQHWNLTRKHGADRPAAHFTAPCQTLLALRSFSMDLPKHRKQAWMSSSQLAPLVRCPRDITDFMAVWAGLGLWNLWGRPGGETLDLALHPGVALLWETPIQEEWGRRRQLVEMKMCVSLFAHEDVDYMFMHVLNQNLVIIPHEPICVEPLFEFKKPLPGILLLIVLISFL